MSEMKGLTTEEMSEVSKINSQKKEAKLIISKYPKLVLRGVKVNLDSDWKKAMVSVLALALINIDLSKKQVALTNQISEKFNESLEQETKIELNATSRKELQLVFRIKNFLLASGDVIKPEMIKLDKIIMQNKDIVYRDLFLYYVGAKANLLGELQESQNLAGEIDSSLSICFQDAIQGGINLEAIEKETLLETNTRDEIKEYVRKLYGTLGLQVN